MISTGLDVLLLERLDLTRGRRVGLVTHPAAVRADFSHAIEALQGAGVRLAALFGPEHGLWGAAAAGETVADEHGATNPIPVFSLYGDTLEPTAAMFAGIDLLLFDMQDVGARYYTYLSTLFYLLRAAGRFGIPLAVLDRPNPLGGLQIEGPLLTPGYESFVGIAPLPIRHGLTLGEAARWLNAMFQFKADLLIVPMAGWRREFWYDDTGRPWLPTSPAMAHFSAVMLYPGTCLLEGVNLAEGRGTALPFEICGAPWLDGAALVMALHTRGVPGARFRRFRFIPSSGRYAGQECDGVQIHVVDRASLRPVRLGLELIAAIRALHPSSFAWEESHFDRLIGGGQVRAALEYGVSPDEIAAGWSAVEDRFRTERRQYLEYPD